MSAYMVNRDHIWYLVQAARELFPGNSFQSIEDVDKLGQELWTENVKSVSARYPNDPPDPSVWVYGQHDAATQQPHANLCRFDPVQLIKSVHCYQYQSSEHDGWERSIAASFCKDLLAVAIAQLPGYRKGAVWGAPSLATLKRSKLPPAGADMLADRVAEDARLETERRAKLAAR